MRVRLYLDAIKFEHTIFALPFAYLSMILAAHGWPGWLTFFWITVAMVGARTGAMAANRLIDADVDRKNPRTEDCKEIYSSDCVRGRCFHCNRPSGIEKGWYTKCTIWDTRDQVKRAVDALSMLVNSGWEYGDKPLVWNVPLFVVDKDNKDDPRIRNMSFGDSSGYLTGQLEFPNK